MTTTINISSVPRKQSHHAIRTLTEAFCADPAVQWLFPGKDSHQRVFPRFAAAFGGRAFDRNSAFADDQFAAVSLWLPPGAGSNEEMINAIIEEEVPSDRQPDVAGVFEQMDRFHPKEPHWYLALLGVSPAYQNRGLGSVLLQFMLERCDREGLSAYLESSNAANLSLYCRHGFQQIGEIQCGDSPILYPMIRPPHAPRL